ncbi:glycosyltransferase family 4 protein [Haloferax sp. KTX1]|uniref:glycosyltransferase family 4 protein n=1 Tax=Haloferax sp. KTX1 TaxID=2600597 RepID=UPI0011DCC356|nr:glycosyltransferase family 4 protein [Haloferax sp. KTX1]
MKILQVTPRYPPQSGGVETHVAEISERLVDRGHEVTVLTADAGGDGFRRERRNGVRIKRYRGVAPDGAMHICPQIMRAVRNADADVVHAHNYHSFPLFFAALGVGERRFVVTTHYHGGSASSVRERLLSLYRPFGRWAVRRADAVIAVSEWEREQLARDFDVDATVIPNGLDVERFTSATPFDRERPYLLTVGRLEEYKGVQHVIRAMTDLPEFDLLVAGCGNYAKQLARIVKQEGVEDRVHFLGYVDDTELREIYAGAEVFVTLSEFEAYGMTVAEALSTGTPCVVRERGALIDWIKREGVTSVKDVRPESIVNAIRAIMSVEFCPSGIYEWDTVVERIEDQYVA